MTCLQGKGLQTDKGSLPGRPHSSTTFFAGTSVTTTLADGRSAFASSRALFAVTSALVMLTDTFAAGALRLACLAQPSEFPTGTDAGAFAQLTV